MSRPTWRVYEVRSKSWSRPPKTISTCSTVAAVALEPVVDPRADEPPAELGERPAERRARRRCVRVPVLEGDGRRWQVLDRGEAEDWRPGRGRSRSCRRRAPAGRARRRRSRWPARTARAPRRATPRRPRRAGRGSASASARSGVADRPAERRSAARGGRRPARARWTPWLQKPRGELGQLVVGGQGRPPSSASRRPSGSRASAAAERLEDDARAARPRRDRASADDAVLAELDDARPRPRGWRRRVAGAAAVADVRPDASKRSAARRSTYGV